MKLLLATRSAHKAAEIRRILDDVPDVELVTLDEAGVEPAPEEDHLEPHDTFEANARSKASWFRDRTGLPTVADDSGLEVDALHGRPGVRTKRFSPRSAELEGQALDDANNAHLVERLRGVAEGERGARYVCVAVLDTGKDGVQTFRGEARGVIVDTPRGEGGFGYDPHFLDPELERTFAEIAPGEKDARSHRGKAFRALAEHLRSRGP